VVEADSHGWEVLIGRAGGDHVSIRLLGRLYPDADDYWDGNWLRSSLEIEAGGFHGAVCASLRADEITSFREALEELYTTLSGEALFESMEEWLTLRIAVCGSGGLEIRGTVVDQLGIGNELHFEIAGLDQSDLPAIVAALRQAEASYPLLWSAQY
jgi:hypothetical protein